MKNTNNMNNKNNNNINNNNNDNNFDQTFMEGFWDTTRTKTTTLLSSS